MKYFYLASFIFILTTSTAQDLKTIELLPPESEELNDLSFLKDELEGKSLVMLGEQTHMYGNIFEMKARVIEYLHQELGFTTIAMESSIYDLWKMSKKGFEPNDFKNAIWGVWSSAQEFKRLIKYIEANNLKVIGFDSQVNNASQFVEDLFDYCESENIDIKLDEDDLGIIIEGVLSNGSLEEDDIKFKVYEKELKRILSQLEKLKDTETNYYWKQFVKSLLASSHDAYYNTEEIYTTDFGNKNDNFRDQQMANNLLSYIHRNPNEKIVCWADNIHIINDNSSIQKPVAKDFISMGFYIKNELKTKSYSLATIHANDSLLDTGTKKWHSTPIKKNSFEDELNKSNKPYLFVSSNQDGMKATRSTRLLNFIDFTEARLDQLHDGYIFFQNVSLPKRESLGDSLEDSNKQIDLCKKIEHIAKGENVILKGQILDIATNQPVAFANLILEKEEIYRVADEIGIYELPVKKTMLENATVAISSMGFNTSTIRLEELNDKIYLTPKSEKLSEVLVIGNLSPKAVLKKAIRSKKLNHPVDPFNFYRYGNVLINKNDLNELDLEIITKDFDHGYLSPYVITQRVEQIKWNRNKTPGKYNFSSQFFHYRQNAIRYANILHKRKYKKFKLNFIKSNDVEDEGLYIVAFETERNRWNYTNRSYPTKYSGRVYIDKVNFGIVKVVENWETTLRIEEIEKYFKGYDSYKNIEETTIKEENINYYSDVLDNGKYYATRFSRRRYYETLNKEHKKEYKVIALDSYLFDFEINDVEEIEYYEYNNKKEHSLKRVKYDKDFWNSFYKRDISEKKRSNANGNSVSK